MSWRIWTMAATVALVAVGVVPALNYSGFCLSQGRYLTEAELTDIATQDEFRHYPPHSYQGFVAEVRRPIEYNSFKDFIARNPNCCSLTRTARENFSPAIFHRLVGNFATFVRVEYRVEEGVPDVPETYISHVAITNCGHPWNGVRL